MDDTKLVRITDLYIKEADEARKDRMDMNKVNFDCYHMKQDFSHKMAGQSKEFLGKQALAVEQISTFIQQAIVDIDDWFSVESAPGKRNESITPNEVQILLENELQKIGFHNIVGDATKLGLLGGLIICKVHGKYKDKAKYVAKEQDGKFKLEKNTSKRWNLDISLVRHQDFYPDPTGSARYTVQRIDMDMADVMAMAKGPNAIYDMAEVKRMSQSMSEDENQKTEKSRETGQNRPVNDYRKRVKIMECWGDIIDYQSGELLHENVVWTVANDSYIIQKPKPNPFWHQKSPYVVAPLVSTPFAVWPKALMDAPTRHNIAINELYNLIFDGGMMETFGVRQVRTDWLEDSGSISKGISAGQTLQVSSNAPVGAKVLERVDTSAVSPQSVQVYQMAVAEFQQSALTNDLRLGILPARQVKATEVVEASNSITSVFTGMSKSLEVSFLQKVLELAWLTIAQNMDSMDAEEFKANLGDQRAVEIASMPPEVRFAETVDGMDFKVFGISKSLSKVKDFRKLTSLLQTVGTSEILTEEFIKKYDFGKMLGEIMRALDINIDKIKLDETDMAMMAAQQGMGTPQGGANMQSQIPQASTGPIEETVQSRIGQSFPHQAMSEMKG